MLGMKSFILKAKSGAKLEDVPGMIEEVKRLITDIEEEKNIKIRIGRIITNVGTNDVAWGGKGVQDIVDRAKRMAWQIILCVGKQVDLVWSEILPKHRYGHSGVNEVVYMVNRV